MANTEPFELYSSEYDKWFIDNSRKYYLELSTLKPMVPPGQTGLEIGVGTGRFAAPLGIKTGVEPSAGMTVRARETGIIVIRGVAENLPLRDRCFDFVLMVTTICFVDDLRKSFREASRVLRSHGYIIIGFIDSDSVLGKKYLKRKSESKFYSAARFYSTAEVINLLEESGFSDFKIRYGVFQEDKVDLTRIFPEKGSFVAIKACKRLQ